MDGIGLLRQWFTERIPSDWFAGPVELAVDRDEILVTGELPAPTRSSRGPTDHDLACRSGIVGFRDDTRDQRIRIAAEAELRFERKVSWAVRCDGLQVTFTTTSVPVMTRLRMAERVTLDTLIDAGVARSRSEALAWCVRLVGQHEEQWIGDLRQALAAVDGVRAAGPRANRRG